MHAFATVPAQAGLARAMEKLLGGSGGNTCVARVVSWRTGVRCARKRSLAPPQKGLSKTAWNKESRSGFAKERR